LKSLKVTGLFFFWISFNY